MLNNLYFLAQAYGSGAYGSSTYENGSTSVSTVSSSSSNGGILTNTGFDVLLSVTLAATIIFVALVVRLWKRSPRSE